MPTVTAPATVDKYALKTEEAYLTYMMLGSYAKAGEALGVSEGTVRARLRQMTGEERERAWSKARGVMGDNLIKLIFQAFGVLPDKVANASMRDLVGLVKVFMEKVLLIQGEATSRSETSNIEAVFNKALKELDKDKEKQAEARLDEAVPTMVAD